MSVQLFPHNQIAYNSALEMLESCGKAAIVHPTGTGKSFIGFKLCEEKRTIQFVGYHHRNIYLKRR